MSSNLALEWNGTKSGDECELLVRSDESSHESTLESIALESLETLLMRLPQPFTVMKKVVISPFPEESTREQHQRFSMLEFCSGNLEEEGDMTKLTFGHNFLCSFCQPI